METEMGAGKEIIECKNKRKRKEKESVEVMNRFEGLMQSNQRLLGRKKEGSQWVSQHFIHYMFNQIYAQGHRCVTGRLIVLQSDGD